MDVAVTNNEQQTMSSSQLAELLGYEKKEINRKIKSMFSEKIDGGTVTPSFDSRGYVSEYFLPELESKMFVAKWDIKYLETITQFWIDRNKTKELPTAKELALMVIKAEEEKEAAMLEVDRLQGVCNTITAQFASGTTTTAFAKQLNGVNVQQVNNKLLSMGVLIKTVNGFEPASYYRDRYFKLSFHEYKDSEENDRRKSKITLTKAGAKWLYRAYLSNKLPMKKTWDGKFVHMIFE